MKAAFFLPIPFLFLGASAFGHGIVISDPGTAVSALAKTRAKPDFFSLMGGTFDKKNNFKPVMTYESLYAVCGRGAEIHLKIEKKSVDGEKGTDDQAAKIKAALRSKIDGMCISSLEFVFEKWPRNSPGELVSWAKVLGKVITGADYALLINSPPLSDKKLEEVATLPYAEAEEILKSAGGLTVYFQHATFKTSEPFLALLKSNLIWANRQAVKLKKRVVFYLPSSSAENAAEVVEGFKAIRSLKGTEAAGLCSGAVKIGLILSRLEDPKLDREIVDYEKWLTDTCATLPKAN